MSRARNRVLRGRYVDSVALMRASRRVAALPGVREASLVIGTPSNIAQLRRSGLLATAGAQARPDDLVIAVRAKDLAAASRSLDAAVQLLEPRPPAESSAAVARGHDLASALAALPTANLALISVPGEFAGAEARRALERGLHVMLFSDNVALADEVALKRLALEKGLMLMGPDCGTCIIGGVPLAFANAVPQGDLGIVSASGTGLQEVSCLLVRAGRGISHGIGVGGRDLSDAVGGLMTFAALEALERDAATRHVVVISKPPSRRVAAQLLARIAKSRKRYTLCLLGAGGGRVPRNATLARSLHAAAEAAAGVRIGCRTPERIAARGGWIRGFFCGGTLCAEAQLILQQAGLAPCSNVPVPGAARGASPRAASHVLIDLGAEEYTLGRPHPMIDPEQRGSWLAAALRDRRSGAVLLDVVIGYGAHHDPAGLVAEVLERSEGTRPPVIASVTGTEADPQVYSRQAARLRGAGVIVASSNARAAELAVQAVKSPSAPRSARHAVLPSARGTRRSAGARPGRSAASLRGRR